VTEVPAKGGEASNAFGPSYQYSKRDAPAFRELKERKPGQAPPSEVKRRDLKAELEQRERLAGKRPISISAANQQPPEALLEQQSRNFHEPQQPRSQQRRMLVSDPADADDGDDEQDEAENGNDDDDEDDDEEDDLMAELERVKQERADERERKEREQAQQHAKQEHQSALAGNPLLGDLNSAASTGSVSSEPNFAMKRRWYEDVPFKNTAQNEPQKKRRFINDTIRSEFHQNFLRKYVR